MTANKPTTDQIKAVSDKFAESHSVKFEELFEQDRVGIYWLQKIFEAVNSGLRSKVDILAASDSTWAITQTMLHRVYELCEGSFVGFITGTWSSAEVSVRAVMEAAVNVMYITSQDKEKRVVQYLTHFWNTEKKLNQKRLEMASRLQGQEAIDQKKSAEFNVEYEKFREDLINQILKNDGFPTVNESGWPTTIADRFISLGMEIEYKTTYSFLSSEVHNDASALVDYMLYKALEDYTPEEAGLEVYLRNRMYLYMGLGYFIKASGYYSDSFSLDVTDEIAQARKAVAKITYGIAQEIIELRNSVEPLKRGKKR